MHAFSVYTLISEELLLVNVFKVLIMGDLTLPVIQESWGAPAG